jgi:hypothetical protein
MIPRLLIQTSPADHPDPVVRKHIVAQLGPGWTYRYFTDADILEYFRNNPLLGYENIERKWYAMPSGPLRADLFRYYFLYINGGVFLDSDAMIYTGLSKYCEYDFFAVETDSTKMFNGFVGCRAQSPIMQIMLYDAYWTNTALLASRHQMFLESMKNIVYGHSGSERVIICQEQINEQQGHSHIVDNNRPIAVHYYKHKIIPNPGALKLWKLYITQPQMIWTLIAATAKSVTCSIMEFAKSRLPK